MPKRIFAAGASALLVFFLGAVLAPSVAAHPQRIEVVTDGEAPPFGPQGWDWRGRAVALEGPFAYVGAFTSVSPINGDTLGSVEVYRRGEDGWTFLEEVYPRHAQTSSSFGEHLAASGSRFAVSAMQLVTPLPTRGAVYVYDRSSGASVLEALIFPTCTGNGGFGKALDLDGDTLVIGVLGERCGNPGLEIGAVHLYDRGPSGWSLTQTITNTGENAFGKSVSIEGDRLVVGSWTHDTICYERIGGIWTETQRFPPPSTNSRSEFGNDVQISGDILTIADDFDTFQLGVRPGLVHIYRWQNGLWVYQQEISTVDVSQTPIINDLFGFSVAIHEGTILVGCPRQSTVNGGAYTTGAAYLFEEIGGVWVETMRIDYPPTIAENGGLGNSVAISSDAILIGAPSLLVPGIGPTGSALTYWLDLGAEACAGEINSTGSAATLRVTGRLSAAEEILELRASNLPPHSFVYFLAARSTGFTPNPGGSQGNLCLAGGISRLIQWGGQSDMNGEYHVSLDPTQIPWSPAALAIQPGETWSFQGWYRDANPAVTSNFTEARSVTFE